jgi:hypothetical protein
MIAAAMLGKRVEYWPSNYHKLPAIAEFSLANYPLREIDPDSVNTKTVATSTVPSAEAESQPRRLNDWLRWVHSSAHDIAEAVPALSTCILVDNGQLGELPVYNRLFLPFLERDGEYFGSPADSREAIMELERLRSHGAEFVVFAWTAFWWLDTYPEFLSHIRKHYASPLQNERLIIFELRARTDV